MSLTIKAYLEKTTGNPEIRRFCVDQTVSSSLDYLKGKIAHIFPSLRNEQYDLFWKDSDNDMVSFSSDDELTDALGYINDAVFRVFIRPIVTNSCSNVVHKGVVCDCCEKEIEGPRFKCTTCPDYDLCSRCEAQGKHNDHDMLRMCTPKSTGFMNFPFMPPFGPPPPHPHHGHHPPHHGYGPPEDCPPPHCPPGGGPPPYMGPPGMWPWKRFWKRHWRRMMRGEAGEGCSGGPWSHGGSRDSSRDGKEDDEANCNDKESEQNQKCGAENAGQPNKNNEEYLRNMGESVAAMLDPLGIDVKVDVETQEAKFRCGRGRGGHRGRGRGRGWWGMFGGPWGYGFPRGGYGGCQGREESENKEQEKEDVKSNADEECMQTESDGAAMSDTVSEAEPKTPSAPVDLTRQDKNKQNSPGHNEADWTMLDKDKETETSNTLNTDARVVYPQLPSGPSQNPVIADALIQMQAMGYNDDGGWLTNLLVQKNGNINQVLDALQPRK